MRRISLNSAASRRPRLLLLARNAGARRRMRRREPRADLTRAQLERRGRDDPRDLRHGRQRLRPEQSRRRQGAVSLGEPRPRAHARRASIEDILLFAEGDRFAGARARRVGARAARAAAFIAEATVEPGSYDAATNSVDVNVRVRDSWSLALDLKLNRSGGENEWGIGLSDGNLFGTGKTLDDRLRERDRSRRGAARLRRRQRVRQPRAARGAVFANASDGHRRELAVERPFFSLDTRWSLGGAIHDEQRVDTMYDLGEEIDEFGHDIDCVLAARRLVARPRSSSRAQRWLFGVTSEEHTFAPTPDVPQPLLLPPDRKLVYPWLGWQLARGRLSRDERAQRHGPHRGHLARAQPVRQPRLREGALRLRPRRDAVDAHRAEGLGARRPRPPAAVRTRAARRATRTIGLRNSQSCSPARTTTGAISSRHLFSVSLSALATDDLDPENQVLLGGDNGLRGYPIRYQAGETPRAAQRRAAVLHGLLSVAAVPRRLGRVRATSGRVSGHGSARHAEPWARSTTSASGLRLSSPRASGRNVVHIDLAFPLNGDPGRSTTCSSSSRRKARSNPAQNGLPSMSCAPGSALMRSSQRVTFGHLSVS